MTAREIIENALSNAATYLMVATFLASLVFVLQYQIRTAGDWRLTQTGRNIMVTMIALTLILLSVCLSRILGPYALQSYIQVVAYGTALVVIFQRNMILDARQRQARSQYDPHAFEVNMETDPQGIPTRKDDFTA